MLYESTGRLGGFDRPRYDNLLDDFAYLEKHYFNDPNYLRIDGRPVLFIYLTREYFRNRGLDELAEVRKQFPTCTSLATTCSAPTIRPNGRSSSTP